MSIVLSAPIPGQSLTKEPKNQRFERPADTASPLVALDMHIDNITRPEALKDAFYFLESGLSLVGLVEGILRSAVMGGRHSLDVSLIIAPVLHEYIKGCKTYAHLPPHEELSLYHPKTIEKQTQQNMFYNQNFSKEMNVRKM